MRIEFVRESSVVELESSAHALIVGCGYEHRSQGITSLVSDLPSQRLAICFTEFADILGRPENEAFFRDRGFRLETVGANDAAKLETLIRATLGGLSPEHPGIAFDISTMTRSWHGAIVRHLRSATYDHPITTYFAYTPSVFQPPIFQPPPNEFVAPVEGFSSLSAPDLPVAAIIGLGYEREGALGLQQLLDPALTVLLIPRAGEGDRYHSQVMRNNADIMVRTSSEWILEYALSEPANTFATLVSVIGGLRQSHRIVMASLGPKMFGLVCFLLATEFPDVSVWRISSGIHGQPRDSYADLARATVLAVTWVP